jgi:hypothetical protein
MITLASYPAVTGAYPEVETVNNTAPTSNDGTPLTKALFDDIFGVFQAVTSQGGVIPSGSNETYDESDFVNGIRNIAGGPGEIVIYGGNSQCLYRSTKRLLPCYGQTIAIDSYPELVAANYYSDTTNLNANAWFKCSDVDGLVRDVAGPYFCLPDFRGMFLRGYDNGSGIDPDSSRYTCSIQESGIKEHSHILQSPGYSPSQSGFVRASDLGSGADYTVKLYTTNSYPFLATEFDDSIEEETRPINMNLIICVRY